MFSRRIVLIACLAALLFATTPWIRIANADPIRTYEFTITDASDPALMGTHGILGIDFDPDTGDYAVRLVTGGYTGILYFYGFGPGGDWEVLGTNGFSACQYGGFGHFTLSRGGTYVTGSW